MAAEVRDGGDRCGAAEVGNGDGSWRIRRRCCCVEEEEEEEDIAQGSVAEVPSCGADGASAHDDDDDETTGAC